MKGFEKGRTVLEFDKIMAIAAGFAYTESGKEAILGSIPSTDPVVVNRKLDETEEALELLTYKGAPPLYCASGILHAVERSHKGAVLTATELLAIAALLRTVTAVKQYGAGKEHKALEVYFFELMEQKSLAEEIEHIIIAEDMIADDASDDLLRIRRAIRRAENEVREVLNRIITGPAQKHLQEAIVTQRSGRFVVPVKASEKNAIKGIVHDSSASGATLFIEPAGVVEANNKLRDLMGQEKEEIEKIMRELSATVSSYGNLIITDYRTVTHLDVIFTRASYSSHIRAMRPKMGGKEICIVRGRHPSWIPQRWFPPLCALETGRRPSSSRVPTPAAKPLLSRPSVCLPIWRRQASCSPAMTAPPCPSSQASLRTSVTSRASSNPCPPSPPIW